MRKKQPYDWRKIAAERAQKALEEAAVKEAPWTPDDIENEEPMARETPTQAETLASTLTTFMEMMNKSQESMQRQIADLGRQIASERVETRVEVKKPQRPQARETGITTVVGRDGEILTRRAQFASTDPFELPPEFIQATLDEGYSLEWKTEYVYNEHRGVYVSRLQRDGAWRPVQNKRLPGVFANEDEEEPVRHDGMMLMERPLELTLAARREEQISAREQVLMRQRNWGVDSKRQDYFDPSTQEAQKHTVLRSMREVADPSWAPSHTIAGNDEFS